MSPASGRRDSEIVKKVEAGIDDADAVAFFLVFRMDREPQRVAARQHETVRLDHPAGQLARNGRTHSLQHQAFDAIVGAVSGHLLEQLRVVPLVDSFVALQIDRPVAGAVEQRDIGLLRQHLRDERFGFQALSTILILGLGMRRTRSRVPSSEAPTLTTNSSTIGRIDWMLSTIG
jgi:hypothetical protein